MELEEHGGSCCGVKHIYGFDGGTETELDELIQEVENSNINNNRLIEVILSERQVNPDDTRYEEGTPPWPAILRQRGFTLVNAFRNSNSGRNCYVFHLINRPLPFATDAELSFPWYDLPTEAPEPVDVAAPDRREPLFTRGETVFNIRSGQTGTIVEEPVFNGRIWSYFVLQENDRRTVRWVERNLQPSVALVPPPVITLVRTYYRNILRNGVELGTRMFASTQEARSARLLRRDGRYPMNRYDVYSDGSEVITRITVDTELL